jgi:hypothetical protein
MNEAIVAEVDKAALVVSRSWTGVLDFEDIRNGTWVKILESPKTLESLESYEEGQRGRVLRAIARQCVGAELADQEVFSAQVYYSTDDVRRILSNGGAMDIPGSPSHVEWIDAQEAMKAISPRHAEVLFSRYVAEDYDASAGVSRMNLTRARDALAVAMNRLRREAEMAHEGPGSRRVLSNSATHSLSKREGGDR